MKPGDLVPEFSALDDTGATLTLAELTAEGPLVLFFYPAAMTPGCTRESCHFRDLAARFAAAGAKVAGISADPVGRQAQFRDRHQLGFPLLSDPEGSIAGMFGVRRPGRLPNRRVTFVIGADRRVQARFASELRVNRHAEEALATIAPPGGSGTPRG